MRLLGLFGLGWAVLLAAGGGGAGEADLMAMHGDGQVRVNSFRPLAPAEESPAKLSSMPDAFRPGNPDVPPRPAAGKGAGAGYLEWKNTCRPPAASAGLILDRECGAGYRLVAPFLAPPPETGKGYLELLARELAGG